MQDVGFWSAAAVLPLSKAQAWLAHSIIRTQEADKNVGISVRMSIGAVGCVEMTASCVMYVQFANNYKMDNCYRSYGRDV